jgi:multisubunit Na+/H+ antiporter MnhB subunit
LAKSNFSQKTVGLKQPLLIAVAIAALTLPFHSEPGGGRGGGVLVGVTTCLHILPCVLLPVMRDKNRMRVSVG